MKTLTQMQSDREQKRVALAAIIDKAGAEDRDLLDDEQIAFDELLVEVKSLDTRITQKQTVESLKAATVQPTNMEASADPQVAFGDPHVAHVGNPGDTSAVIHQTPRKREKGETVARMIRALAATKGDPWRAAEFAEKKMNDLYVAKALSASDAVTGGFMVPTQDSNEIIELLRPESVVRRADPMIMPLINGSATLPKIASGASASFIGENNPAPVTGETFGQIRLTARKLAALVPISNDLIRFGSNAADGIVKDDLVAAVTQREDAAFIRDDGTDATPIGLRYLVAAANVIAANATVNLANVTTDMGYLVLALKNANVRFRRPAWFMAPRTEQYLMDVRDTNGNFAFRPELLAGNLRMYPYFTTTQIPTNLGGGGNESELILADMADFVIGDALNIALDISPDATYDEGGTLVSAFQRDQTVIRAIHEVDCNSRHNESIAVLTGVTWGA